MIDAQGREWQITVTDRAVAIKPLEPIGKRYQMLAVRAPIEEAMPILREWADAR